MAVEPSSTARPLTELTQNSALNVSVNPTVASSNGDSQHFTTDDLSPFRPEVQKALRKLQLVRDGISIEPIIRKIEN
jgi:hypothetical protein